MSIRILTRVALLIALSCTPSMFAQSPFSFQAVSPVSLELRDSGKPVFVYNYGMVLKEGFPDTMRRSTYLHPVYLPDGTAITDDFNPDHPHHRGISWMWPVVIVDGKTHDLWTVGGIRQQFIRWTAREVAARYALLGVENGWYLGDRKVVNEQVEIRVQPVRNGRRDLEFTLRFSATDQPIEIAGTPDGNKGFGGFCFRFAPRDGGKDKTIIRTDQGIATKDGVMEVHPWAQVEGSFQGRPGGARVEDDRGNPGFPNGWLMRHGFGFLNVSYPGMKPVRLEKDKPLVLKYRVTLFAGEMAGR
jgi:hypothetical protein